MSDIQALWDSLQFFLVFAQRRGCLEQTFDDGVCLLVFALLFMLLHHYLFVNVGEDGQDEGGVTQDGAGNIFDLKVFSLHQGK